MLVFSGTSNKLLAARLAKALKTRLGKIELSKFPNDEIRVWVTEKNVGKRAVVVQSLSHRTDNHLMQFCLICDALKRKGVNKIIAVIPWMGYSKQDKAFRPGEPLSAQVVAKMLEVTQLTKIITYDLHKPEIARFFKTKVINLSGRRVFREYFKNKVDQNTVVVAPDEGARNSSKRFAYDLKAHVAYIKKKRDLNTGKVTVRGISRSVAGKKILIKDDMIATGSTLIEAAKFLKTQNVASIAVAATHHLYLPGVQEKLDQSGITNLVVTDTVEPKARSKKLTVVSVAEMIAKEIRN
ncbi:MAG: ribose-phosphate pyrophosphokinase [Candidatus Beckwithbacteria bacterium]|nr:ribose-phosphate pyrophosphokinase [Candidatus Beckwithbacteria bacterium]